MQLADRFQSAESIDRQLMIEAYKIIPPIGDIEQQRQRWLRFDALLRARAYIDAAMMLMPDGAQESQVEQLLASAVRQAAATGTLVTHLPRYVLAGIMRMHGV